MTTPVKIVTTRVTDEFGGEYQNAIVALWSITETSTNSWVAAECKGDYTRSTESEAIVYRASFWYDAKTKAEGYPSRPLNYRDEDGVAANVFTVNQDVDTNRILSGTGDSLVNVISAVELDFYKKYK